MIAGTKRLVVNGLRVIIEGSRADVVDEVSFSLAPGETMGLVGESGSGKTTVALAVMGHARRGLRIDRGEVLINGTDLLLLSARELQRVRGSEVAYVAQDPASALNPTLKIKTQLREVLAKAKGSGSRKVAPDRLEEVLGDVRLDPERVLDAYPHQLSGGQQQRVALAMAFALRPAVIVLDEPTTGLDVTTQRYILETVQALCRDRGVAAMFVSHDLAVIGELADQVAVLYAGRATELGTVAQVFAAPLHPYTAGLLDAVPSTDQAHSLVGMKGEPPRPGGRPEGCFFAPRCPHCQIERCTVSPPPLAQVGGRQLVRCVRAAELPERRRARHVELARGSARSEETLVSVRGVTASYGDTAVVEGVDLELRQGECLAVVGESGSGKTTLARCIVGLHRRWEGEISWRGRELGRAASKRSAEELRAIQYVFQNPYASLNPRKSIGQIVEQPLRRFQQLDATERERRVVQALESTALSSSFLDRYPAELSGGERQRVAVARALVIEPEVLVCDEITSALDVSVQAAIVEMLRQLQAERGLSLVVITHNLALVRSIAGRVAVMSNGVFVEQADTGQVLDRPEDEYTRRLLSDLPRLETVIVGRHDPVAVTDAALETSG